VTVYAAEQANPLKVERMRALGANVVLFGDDFDELGRRLQDDVGPELERPLPQRRGERGINDGQGAALAGARRDGGDVGDDEQRVGD
jgi:threonine dehydratase